MRRKWSALAVLLVFALAVGVGIVSTAQAGNTDRTWTFQNPDATGPDHGRMLPFTHSPDNGVATCSGSCNCSSCSCSGGFDCCLAGCIVCWEVSGCLS